MGISGFTFVHNAINAGIPIRESINAVWPFVDEVVVVDAASTDGTKEWLSQFADIKLIHAEWGQDAGETLRKLHALNTECGNDVIIHFEADEVYSEELIDWVCVQIQLGNHSIEVPRIQVEQNFQRVRWYPEYVHRVFQRGTVTKDGHTTKEGGSHKITDHGYLWDVTNCFKDQYFSRIEQQAKLWSMQPANPKAVQMHSFSDPENGVNLDDEHWTWETSPLDIPEILKPLLGKTKYVLS